MGEGDGVMERAKSTGARFKPWSWTSGSKGRIKYVASLKVAEAGSGNQP